LKYIARRHPAPDPRVYVQTSWDAKGERSDLDQKRVQAVQNYLASVMANHPGTVTFDVVVSDAAEPGMPARPAPNLYVRPISAQLAATQAQSTTVTSGPGGTTTSTTTQGAGATGTGYVGAQQAPGGVQR